MIAQKMNKQTIAVFLREARLQSSYEVLGESLIKKLPNGMDQIGPYNNGPWSYVDRYRTYDGDTRFRGRETISFDGKKIWYRQYYGKITNPTYREPEKRDGIYWLMRMAMRRFPKDLPFRRGQSTLIKNEYRYDDKCDGNIILFRGVETISHNGKVIYKLTYSGRLNTVRN